jgi:3-methyl-2-oxobutanoate hydroxymethyltransferase
MAGKSADKLRDMKRSGERIAVLTAYDYPTARFVEAGGVDALLVGDSLAVVVLGYKDTRQVTLDVMIHHTGAARRGAPNTHLIGDMPVHSYDTPEQAVESARRFRETGADSVKVEGAVFDVVRALRSEGIPVMGHVGVTPQTSGYRLRGRDAGEAQTILEEARGLESAGCYAVVLENVQQEVACEITCAVGIPTIGIGAGPRTDGQVLVIHDMLGLYGEYLPPFAKRFVELGVVATEACRTYVREVRAGHWPDEAHSR